MSAEGRIEERRRRSRSCLGTTGAVVAAAVAFGALAMAQASAATPPGPAADGAAEPALGGQSIRVECNSPKARILPLEPLIAELRVTNMGTGPATFIEPEFGAMGLEVEVHGPQGRSKHEPAVYGERTGPVRIASLQPNEVYTYRMRIHRMGRDKPDLFSEPGKYVVVVQFTAAEKVVPYTEPPFQWPVYEARCDVTVTKPSAREEKALSLWRQGMKDSGGMLNRAGARAVPEFDELCNTFPDTAYGQYCMFFRTDLDAATQVYFKGSTDGSGAAEDCGRWAALLLKQAPDFPLIDETTLALARATKQTGRQEEAERLLETVVPKLPDSVLFESSRTINEISLK